MAGRVSDVRHTPAKAAPKSQNRHRKKESGHKACDRHQNIGSARMLPAAAAPVRAAPKWTLRQRGNGLPLLQKPHSHTRLCLHILLTLCAAKLSLKRSGRSRKRTENTPAKPGVAVGQWLQQNLPYRFPFGYFLLQIQTWCFGSLVVRRMSPWHACCFVCAGDTINCR